jgi:hypothetical protein
MDTGKGCGSLELLVLSTSACEVSTPQTNGSQGTNRGEPSDGCAEAAPAFNDRLLPMPRSRHGCGSAAGGSACHEWGRAWTAAEEVVPMVQPAAPVAEPSEVPAASSEDQDTHRKAQRFARLLVDEVKLYNQAKVAEGRKHKDLYDRLKEAIEKSRSTFQKRYGNTVAASGDYFQHELVRSLAEDDVSIMGANFRH